MIRSSRITVKHGFLSLEKEESKPPTKPRSSSCPPLSSSDCLRFCLFSRTVSSVSTEADIPAFSPSSSPDPPHAITTLMIRNIPTRFTSLSFLELMEISGYSETFDFFYLPMDFKTGKNMGYAFLNFIVPQFAQHFTNQFNNTRLAAFTSSVKILQISPSRRQGLVNNVELFRNSDLLSSDSFPMFKPFVQIPSWWRFDETMGIMVLEPSCLVPLTMDLFSCITTSSF